MIEQYVEVDYAPPLATIFFSRPEVLNAYNEELLDQFKKEVVALFSDEQIKAVILTGRGQKAFSVGADLKLLEDLDFHDAERLADKGKAICDLIEKTEKVVLAAVNGHALGGAMEITLACDLRIASTRARFGQPEVTLGLIPGFSGTQRLPRVLGIGRAKELLFTGNIIDAEEAFEIGLVNKLVTPRDLLKETKNMANRITKQSSEAVGLIKNAINYGYCHGCEEGKEFETNSFKKCFKNEEHIKRIKKMKESLKK
ncbi:MAG: enoyl-CoA hydratase/isomerase family protein [Halanaerobiales bacterium]|nr:enoyl-CoA hydratase/isomerase family protein [Halanaerobiales bacterium]